MSLEDARKTLLMGYANGLLKLMKNFQCRTMISSHLIRRTHTGISTHFLWIHLILASVKPTFEWRNTTFLFYWMLFRFRKLVSAHKEQSVAEWKGSA